MLKDLGVAELTKVAQSLDLPNATGLRKQELIFRIEQALLDAETPLYGEGVLEVLPEGYGFLRVNGTMIKKQSQLPTPRPASSAPIMSSG